MGFPDQQKSWPVPLRFLYKALLNQLVNESSMLKSQEKTHSLQFNNITFDAKRQNLPAMEVAILKVFLYFVRQISFENI